MTTNTTVDPRATSSPTYYLICDDGVDVKSAALLLRSDCAGHGASWRIVPGASAPARSEAGQSMYYLGSDL